MKRPLLVAGIVLVVIFFGAKRVTRPGTTATSAESQPTNQTVTTDQSCPGRLGTTKRVGIQAGHWQIDQLPNELSSLRWDFGTSAGSTNEVDINLAVAQKVATELQKAGVATDILPATIPTDYCANAFVAIHADGNDDSTVRGYKVAPSSWDVDGKALALSNSLVQDYGQITQMRQNAGISANMTQYYAFNYQKFSAAIDPKTPGALIELGFITNSADRALLVHSSDLVAHAVATGILDYLNNP